MAMSPEERRARNREKNRRWRKNNPEAARACKQRFNEKHPERVKESVQSWRERNRERIRISKAEWRARNPERCRQAERRYRLSLRTSEPQGKTTTESLFENKVFAAAHAAVPRGLDDQTRDDVIGDIIMAVYEGSLTIKDIPKQAKRFVSDHFKRFSTYKHVQIEDVPSLA